LVTFARTLEHNGFLVLVEALGRLVKDGRTKSIEVRKINGAACDDVSPSTVQVVAMLEQHRFVRWLSRVGTARLRLDATQSGPGEIGQL